MKKAKKIIKDQLEAVICRECSQAFTPSGLRMHTGSSKCAIAKQAIPLRLEAEEAQEALKRKGKSPILTNVALALYRRNLTQVSGLEKAATKLIHTDIDVMVANQWWAYTWVHKLWAKHNKEGYTRTAYAILESLNALSIEDRESKIGLILLNMYA